MRLPFLGMHCTRTEASATNRACDILSSMAANSMKGRFTDIFPFKPGRETLICDAAMDRTMKQAKRTRSTDSHRINPTHRKTSAQIATRPTKNEADCGVRFIDDSLSVCFCPTDSSGAQLRDQGRNHPDRLR